MTPTAAFIRIDFGTVTAYSASEFGKMVDTQDIVGTKRFFVAVSFDDQSEMGLWDGADYEDAMREAEAARKDFEIDEPVHDLVAGGSR